MKQTRSQQKVNTQKRKKRSQFEFKMPGKPMTGVKPWHCKKEEDKGSKVLQNKKKRCKVHKKRSKVLQKIDAKCIKPKTNKKKDFNLS